MHASGERWRLGHRPGLDGLRGLAVLLVLAGHADPFHFEASGAVGVTVFFTLSGFLITALLLEERHDVGRVGLGGFYARRARRLLPALLVFLTVMAGLQALGVPLVAQPVREFAAALFYCSNFFAWEHWTGFGHLWSLSVEEQFYIVFPLCLMWALRRGAGRRGLLAGIGAAAVISTVLRVALSGNVDLAYHATETNAVALLVGCFLAVAMHDTKPRPWLGQWAVVAVAGIVTAGMLGAAVTSPWLVPAVALLTVVVLRGVATTGRSWLGVQPLTYLGRRSYALYLWHFPFATLAWKGELPMWVAIVTAFAAAEASWWLVERRFLRWRQAAAWIAARSEADHGAPANATSSTVMSVAPAIWMAWPLAGCIIDPVNDSVPSTTPLT